MSKNIERVLDVNPYTTSGRGSRSWFLPKSLLNSRVRRVLTWKRLSSASRNVAVDGLIKVVDVGETQPEVAQRPVYGLSQSVRH